MCIYNISIKINIYPSSVFTIGILHFNDTIPIFLQWGMVTAYTHKIGIFSITSIFAHNVIMSSTLSHFIKLLHSVQRPFLFPIGWTKVMISQVLFWFALFVLSFFIENQYPDEAKREEIANACNAVIQKPGKWLQSVSELPQTQTSCRVAIFVANDPLLHWIYKCLHKLI